MRKMLLLVFIVIFSSNQLFAMLEDKSILDAIEKHDMKTLKNFLEASVSSNVVYYNSEEIAQLLLEKGADVSGKDFPARIAPLHLACSNIIKLFDLKKTR